MKAQVMHDELYDIMLKNDTKKSPVRFQEFWEEVFEKYQQGAKKDNLYYLEDLAKMSGKPVKFFLFKCYGRRIPWEVDQVADKLIFIT